MPPFFAHLAPTNKSVAARRAFKTDSKLSMRVWLRTCLECTRDWKVRLRVHPSADSCSQVPGKRAYEQARIRLHPAPSPEAALHCVNTRPSSPRAAVLGIHSALRHGTSKLA